MKNYYMVLDVKLIEDKIDKDQIRNSSSWTESRNKWWKIILIYEIAVKTK